MNEISLRGIDDLSWADRSLCAEVDPELHFPEKGGSTREAKRVCRSCEVRAECLEYALETDQRFGIWGGMSERERRRLKRRPGTAAERIAAADAERDARSKASAERVRALGRKGTDAAAEAARAARIAADRTLRDKPAAHPGPQSQEIAA